MKNYIILSVIYTLILLLSTDFAHSIELKSSSGATIDADIINLFDDSVKIKRKSDRRVFTIRFDKLDDQSVKLLKENRSKYEVKSKRISINLKVSKKERYKRRENKEADYDDKKQVITPYVKLGNEDFGNPTAKIKMVVLLGSR